MSLTNFPNGIETSHIVSPQTVGSTGRVFFVSNSSVVAPDGIAGSDLNSGLSPKTPFRTLDYAIGKCVANRGDVIYVMPGHAETLSTSGAIAMDVAGVKIYCLGSKDDRPTFTFSNTAATIALSANNVVFDNFILKPSVNAVVSPLAITGNNPFVRGFIEDLSDVVEFVRGLLVTGADGGVLDIEYLGRTGGSACVNGIRLVNCANITIKTNFHGKASTAWVEFFTTASADITITGDMFNSGTTNGTKNVVDTVTGSVWDARIWDQSAGAYQSGGSASALAFDDVSVVASDVATIKNNVGGVDGATNIIGADNNNNAFASTNVVSNSDGSIIERLEDVKEVLYGTSGIGTFPAPAVANNGVSLAEVVRHADEAIGADDANNAFASTNVVANKDGSVLERIEDISQELSGSVGIATFPAAAAPGNAVSLAEVIRALYDRQLGDGTNAATNSLLGKRVVRSTADIITGVAVPVFTVTGSVLVTMLSGEVTTIIGAGATNAKFQHNPTTGTTNDICANLDIDADEQGTLYSVSGVASDTMLRSESGAIRNMSSNGLILSAGDIEFITSADRTGSIALTLFYIPLTDGATVVAI